MSPKDIKRAFVARASNNKAYRLLNLESNVIIGLRDLEFFENVLTTRNFQNGTQVDIPASRESQLEASSIDVELSSETRKSKRVMIG